MADQFIGNYRVLKKIGAGGMAQVYLGVHKDIPNLKVVLKILSDPRLVERFRQEADKLALLDGHSSVCRIKHFFNHGDDFVIAMEFIDGATLDETIKKDTRLPIADSLKIICDVLSTLEFAHQKDIFHRDIKPGNIMVDTTGQVKIIDFGIAKSKTDPNLTIAGTSCGTPAYMPPEQFNPTEQINYALVDIYAVGTTLYYMLTGELPFKGDNQFALRDAKMFNDPPSARDLNPGIPKPIDQIILKALAKSPEDRFASAADMKSAIDTQRNGIAKSEPTVSVATPKSPPPTPGKKTTSKTIPLVAALVVVVCAAVAYFIFIKDSGPTLPAAPTPLSPEQGITLNTATPTFVWEGSNADRAAYMLEYAAESDFANPIEKRMLAVTTYTVTEALNNGQYFWRVQAVDSKGNKSELSATMAFFVEIPSAEPAQGTLGISVNPRGDIFIDDELYGENKSDLTATLDTGQHTVRVVNARSRQKELSKSVYLTESADESLAFEFTFPVAKPKVDSGEVIIGSGPTDGGAIFIDGQLQDLRTNNTFKLPVGKHIIKVVLNLEGEELEMVDSILVEKDGLVRKKFDFEN